MKHLLILAMLALIVSGCFGTTRFYTRDSYITVQCWMEQKCLEKAIEICGPDMNVHIIDIYNGRMIRQHTDYVSRRHIYRIYKVTDMKFTCKTQR